MKCKCACLRTRVIDILRMNQETCHASNRDYMAVISARHVWYEFFNEQEVRDRVYVENSAELGFCFVEDGLVSADSGIVDEHGWLAVGFTDLVGYFFDFGGGNVDFIVVYIGGYIKASVVISEL
jgi:hypothetical protein